MGFYWKKLVPEAKLPEYATPGSSGMDVFAVQEADIGPGERVLVKTGLACEIPLGWELQVRPRSGLALKKGVTVLNAPGTIDSDYRQELGVILINHSSESFHVSVGDRVAQLVLFPVTRMTWQEKQELPETERKGGFGSTGV